MSIGRPIIVTGAAGRVGGVGGAVVEALRRRGLPVRALVRSDDERAAALRAIGAEVVVGDLTRAGDVARALAGCRRMYFGLSVSAQYLEATVTAAAVARDRGDLEVFVNISQMTVSQMSLTEMTDSQQQRQHWLAEQALNWSGLPVVHVRPTVFLQHFFFLAWAAESIARDGTIRLPFGSGRTSPIDTRDVAEVIAAILASPAPKGSWMVPSRLIDSAAQSRKKKFCRKMVGRTWTTGNPDQLSACSASQCCRCCGESVISVRLICDTVSWEMLTNTSRSPRCRAAAAAETVASR